MHKKTGVIRAVVVVLPFICLFAVSLCFGYKGSPMIYVPVWNDEVAWWRQINAMVKCGHLLGYWGYNGTHAQVGTFGPWGIASLLPYALFGKIFGWQYHSMAIANTCFLSAALLLLILMTKPTNRQTVWMGIIYLSSYVTISYSCSSMSEGLRYACAIVLAGLIVWLVRCTDHSCERLTRKNKLMILLGCIFLLYCVQVYLILSLAVFPVVLLLLRRQKKMVPAVKFVLAVLATAIVALVSNKLISLVSCPYCQPSTIQTIFDHLRTEGIYRGLCFVLDNFFNNFNTMNYPQLGDVAGEYGGIFVWYFLTYLGLLFFMLRRIVGNISTSLETALDSKIENLTLFLALYFLSGFLVGYCLLYTGSSATLYRGTNTGLMMTLIFLVFSGEEGEKYVRDVALVSLFAVASIWSLYGTHADLRYENSQLVQQIEEERKKVAEVIKISPENDPWDNTAAIYGSYTIWYLSLPTGVGENFIMDGTVCERARYAVMPAGFAEGALAEFQEKEYTLVFQDDIFAIFEKND